MGKKVNVTYQGKLVGTAEVNPDNPVVEIELEEQDLEHIIPGRSLTESLSIAFKNKLPVLEGVTPWDEAWEPYLQGYSDADISMMDLYYKNRPKGTFDA